MKDIISYFVYAFDVVDKSAQIKMYHAEELFFVPLTLNLLVYMTFIALMLFSFYFECKKIYKYILTDVEKIYEKSWLGLEITSIICLIFGFTGIYQIVSGDFIVVNKNFYSLLSNVIFSTIYYVGSIFLILFPFVIFVCFIFQKNENLERDA